MKSSINSPMSQRTRTGLNQPAGISGRNPMVEHGDQPQTATSVGIRFPIVTEIKMGEGGKLNTPMGKGTTFKKPPKDRQMPKVPNKG